MQVSASSNSGGQCEDGLKMVFKIGDPQTGSIIVVIVIIS